jgi:hypothetical protein
MYPRNAASPEPIAIGAVLLTADGTVQTSGVTVRIKPIGVSEADGGGTTSYSTNGIVYYTPTQAETNYTSFILIASKASCIPVAITVVTTASATPGTVLLAPVTHTSAVIPTVTTTTNVTTVNGLAADVITASSISSDGGQEIADAVLTRSASHVEGSAGEHTLCTLILANLEWEIDGTAWKIFRTNGTTLHYEKTATGSSTNDPIHKVE